MTIIAALKKLFSLSGDPKTIAEALDEAEIKYDRQAFRPHITLCRKTALPSPDFRLYPLERPLRGLRLPVKEVKLMASDLSGETPKYTAVYTQK